MPAWSNENLIEHDVTKIDEWSAFRRVQDNSNLSFSFLILLISSIIISTLGLLLNNASIVIGGMIIAPLMWPLLKISLAISYERRAPMRQGLKVLILSVLIGLVSSYLIAFISPIKLVNSEILSRTNPTLLDLVIALAAGTVAAYAVIKPRISESLAGVAVAASLVPPLSVSGIGLALGDISIFAGGMLLFLSNIISILFVGIFIFSFVGQKRHPEDVLKTKSFMGISIVLLATAIPLFLFLMNYSFQAVAYPRVLESLNNSLEEISPGVYLSNVEVTVGSGNENVVVVAEAWLPEDVSIDYKQQQQLIKNLESVLGRNVDLSLKLQKALSIVSEESLVDTEKRNLIKKVVAEEVGKLELSLVIDSIQISYDDIKETWNVNIIAKGIPSMTFTFKQKKQLEEAVEKRLLKDISLNVDIIPRIQLKSEPDIEKSRIEQDIRDQFSKLSEDIDVTVRSITGVKVSTPQLIIDGLPTQLLIYLDLRVPDSVVLDEEDIIKIKNKLNEDFGREFFFSISKVRKEVVTY